MSWTGLGVLYYMLNARDDVYCERAFAPWADMEGLMRANGLPLATLETGEPLARMDMLGFTLGHEMGYSNMLNMLDLAGIPLLAAERGGQWPLVAAGGACACNPEPMADFVDFFYIGEAEAGFGAVLDRYEPGIPKEDFLLAIASLPGVYVPRFYKPEYKPDGTLRGVFPIRQDVPQVITKAAVNNLDAMFTPDRQITPNVESVHDRAVLEIFRGCIRGCRFCQAGFIYRPCREKSPGRLLDNARKILDSTGYDEISLLSLSTGDYSAFSELADGVQGLGSNISLSLPSLRIDAFSLELMERMEGGRKQGLTFAPEAGTQRLRDIINKNLTEEEILEGCRLAFQGGWNRVKLYCMLGLPFETDDDVRGLADLAAKVADMYYSSIRPKKGGLTVNLSASCFVPKPHTPFQFAAQASYDELCEKQQLLKRSIRSRSVKFSYHNADTSVLEGALARGDRRTGTAILEAFKLGARFDGWSEFFDYGLWKRAFVNAGLDMAFYAHRERPYDEVLPWDHIKTGADKPFLISEMEQARRAVTTPDCRTACARCGACGL
jgi:radical SAM family uncharacterized protein